MRKVMTKQNAFKLSRLNSETLEQFQTKIYNNFKRRGYVLSVEEYNEMRDHICDKTYCKGQQPSRETASPNTWFMTYLDNVDKFQFVIQKHYYEEF